MSNNAIYKNVLELIGKTPLVKINKIFKSTDINIYVKLEGQNPGGSVKDRIGLNMIDRAEKNGILTKDKIILESTSGNTGIALAMIGAVTGYKVILTMSEAMSLERKIMMKAFGAELIETDPSKGTAGAIEKARQIYNSGPNKYWMPSQHDNLHNPEAHYQSTANEIYSAVPEVTHFVAGIGTFGTLRGVGKKLKELNKKIQIVGLEPQIGHPIPGMRNMQEPLRPSIYNESCLDQKILVMKDDAVSMMKSLAKEEGLLVGPSSGAAMWGAVQIARANKMANIVVLFPDRGEKYLSLQLFS